MKCGNVWISRVEDCGENKGGYFCQVYADENMEYEIDYFCIHPEDCDCSNDNDVDDFIRLYAEMYDGSL